MSPRYLLCAESPGTRAQQEISKGRTAKSGGHHTRTTQEIARRSWMMGLSQRQSLLGRSETRARYACIKKPGFLLIPGFWSTGDWEAVVRTSASLSVLTGSRGMVSTDCAARTLRDRALGPLVSTSASHTPLTCSCRTGYKLPFSRSSSSFLDLPSYNRQLLSRPERSFTGCYSLFFLLSQIIPQV